jgi:STE24 endopeptidase
MVRSFFGGTKPPPGLKECNEMSCRLAAGGPAGKLPALRKHSGVREDCRLKEMIRRILLLFLAMLFSVGASVRTGSSAPGGDTSAEIGAHRGPFVVQTLPGGKPDSNRDRRLEAGGPAGRMPVLRGRTDDRFVVHVTPEMLQHSRINNILYFAGEAYAMAILLFILSTRISARLRDAAMRVVKQPFLLTIVYFSLLSIVTAILEFPLTYYGSFVVPHEFALTHQSFGGWLADFGKAFGVSVIIGAPIAALAMLAIRLFRRWWIVLWLGTIPVTIIGVVVWPLFIDPLFNDFVPLRDPVLRSELLAEASRAGIEGSRVYQVDKSKQTTTMNAYVTGLGPSKRIVLWDTLLAKMDRDEILAVMGHEMGHYVLHHLWKGLAFTVVISFVVTLVLQPALEWMLTRHGSRWSVSSPTDPAALPALMLIVSLATFLLSPAINGFSRHVEHEADVFGLELTHRNEPMASAFVKLTEDSKGDPCPNAFIEWWRYSHPSAAKRIDFALRYRPGRS